MRDELRALWAEPRVPDPPVRVGRDWLLLAAALIGIVLEAVLRTDVVWWPVSILATAGLALTTLWRRTHPLAMVVFAFGTAIALTLVDLAAGHESSIGLYTGAIIVVLAYALTRWGSGRDIVLGSAVMLAAFVVSSFIDGGPAGDILGGFVFLAFPVALGASVRLWSTARRRELERMRARERENIARELHDTVAHHVSAIVVQAQAGRVLADIDPETAAETLAGVEEEGARTLEAMRAMVMALREEDAGAELSPLPGIADLPRLVATRRGGVPVDLRIDDAICRLPPLVDTGVFRIVQESVTNATRHAVGATAIQVRVVAEPDRIHIIVLDDGKTPGPSGTGYGLTGLRERASILGGNLVAGPCADGWRVEAELPRQPGDVLPPRRPIKLPPHRDDASPPHQPIQAPPP